MQATPGNPYTVRLHSARLANAYMGDLRLAGSRRNTQEDPGEERKYKVTVNTSFIDPVSLLIAGVGYVVKPHLEKIAEKIKFVAENVKIEDIANEAPIQRAKREEELKKQELEHGKTTSDILKQNHEGGVLESFGAAAGKLVVDALSTFDALAKKKEDASKALKDDVVSTAGKK